SCDRECFNLFSFISDSRESWATNSPWQTKPVPDLFRHYYNLNLSSQSTILGDERLEDCLEQLCNSKRPPELIIFFDSCLSKLVGEDLLGPIERFRRTSKIPLVFYDIRLSQFPYLKQLRDFWKDVYQQSIPAVATTIPKSICCLGLHPLVVGECKKILKLLGITNLGTLFPNLSLANIQALASCDTVIANSWEYVRVMFSSLFENLDKPVERLALPYGIKGTNNWFDSVCRSVLGAKSPAIDSISEIQALTDEFMTIQRQLAGHRIGIFARRRGIRQHLSDRLRFGVPLVPLFRELGLAIDLNLFVSEDEDNDHRQIEDELKLDSARGDSLNFYHDFRQLPELLRAGDFQLVYTETFRDDRITSSGKTPLTLNFLVPGYRGAVQTARNLKSLIESSFHFRYAAYFKEPFAHFNLAGGEDLND
ncbi:MAG: hypothetical protein JRJ87_27590, partial [Deltaproteobacteria bacterium]|nr:hypothetical protein [Deltaproteobacteria bacterium]